MASNIVEGNGPASSPYYTTETAGSQGENQEKGRKKTRNIDFRLFWENFQDFWLVRQLASV